MEQHSLTCPKCGYVFVPPAGASFCFCPSCGARNELPAGVTPDAVASVSAVPPTPATPNMPPMSGMMSPEEAQERAQRAIEQAARAAELAERAARLAAQAGSRLEATELARLATAEATEAVRVAQESRRVQERQVSERTERLAAQRAELERALADQAAPTDQAAQPSAAAQAGVAAAGSPDAGRTHASVAGVAGDGPSSHPAPEGASPRPRDAGTRGSKAPTGQEGSRGQVRYRQGATVRHTDGTGLFLVTLPSDWSVRDTGIRSERARPYNPFVQLSNGRGASIHLFQGDVGMRLSAGMKAAMATYGAALAGADETNYAEVPNPIELADDYVEDIVRRVGATDLRLTGMLDAPDLAARRQEALALFRENARAGGGAIVSDPLAADVVRTYRFMLNGELTGFAVHVRLYATKDGSGVENLNPLGLAANVGSALGGLFRRRKATATAGASGQAATTTAWSQPDYDAYVSAGTIYWEVTGIATLSAPATTFDEALRAAFLPLVRSYGLHPDMRGMALGDTRRQAGRMQQATSREIQANNMRTQASMAAARQAQAAADARFDQWMRDGDAHHAAFRERTNAEFGPTAGSGAPDFSEAIRGVNTYRTSDGREVEVDVSADRAWENQAGEVIGTEGSFEPGHDWTEIPRA